jgi:hypothetical protein
MICSGAEKMDFGKGEGTGDEAICPGSFDDATAHLELLTVSPGIDAAGRAEGEDMVRSADDLGDHVGVKGVDGGRTGRYQGEFRVA